VEGGTYELVTDTLRAGLSIAFTTRYDKSGDLPRAGGGDSSLSDRTPYPLQLLEDS
jgi:hypothetical protein